MEDLEEEIDRSNQSFKADLEDLKTESETLHVNSIVCNGVSSLIFVAAVHQSSKRLDNIVLRMAMMTFEKLLYTS